MTLPQKKKKVKQKKRIIRKKRQIYSGGKKRGKKKKRGRKKRLVLNTNAKIKKLQKQVAALKKKVKAQRKRTKVEPGTLLSPRSEAARKGWTTRRAREVERLNKILFSQKVSPEGQERVEKATKEALRNEKKVIDEYIKRLPEYLLRSDKQEFLVERKENLIMHELIIAAKITGNFDARAYELAEEYDLEPYEIYGLWHGYDLDE